MAASSLFSNMLFAFHIIIFLLVCNILFRFLPDPLHQFILQLFIIPFSPSTFKTFSPCLCYLFHTNNEMPQIGCFFPSAQETSFLNSIVYERFSLSLWKVKSFWYSDILNVFLHTVLIKIIHNIKLIENELTCSSSQIIQKRI